MSGDETTRKASESISHQERLIRSQTYRFQKLCQLMRPPQRLSSSRRLVQQTGDPPHESGCNDRQGFEPLGLLCFSKQQQRQKQWQQRCQATAAASAAGAAAVSAAATAAGTAAASAKAAAVCFL
ncbi:hypothetical protein Emag_007828 [Eimeria magna]